MPRRPRRGAGAASRRHQRGVALLVAILLVALGTMIAATLAYNNAMTARRAAATLAFDQALLISEGAEALAAYGLQQQAKQSSQYIYPGQAWSQPLPPTEVIPGVTLQASLEDLQGRFNINDLVGTDGETPNTIAIQSFQRLLTMLNMDPKWANYIVDWIDKDTTPMFPDGAEDSVYMEMSPPYRTPNLPITSTSELMALPGFTRADFNKLAPHIVALPVGASINQCSADPWVLDALTGTVQFSADPDRFYKDREAAGDCFPPIGQVTVQGTPAGNGPTVPGGEAVVPPGGGGGPGANAADLVGHTSTYFRLTSIVTLGSTQFSVYTLLLYDPAGTRTMMRSFTPD